MGDEEPSVLNFVFNMATTKSDFIVPALEKIREKDCPMLNIDDEIN